MISFTKTKAALDREIVAVGSLLPGDIIFVPAQSIVLTKCVGANAILLRLQLAMTQSHTLARAPR